MSGRRRQNRVIEHHWQLGRAQCSVGLVMLPLLAALPVFSLLDLAFASADGITVHPRLITSRVKRESHLADEPAAELQVHLNLGSKPLHLLLAENQALSLGFGVIEWVHPNGSVTTEPIVNALKTEKSSPGKEKEAGRCFYSGSVRGEKSSLGKNDLLQLHSLLLPSVAVNVCGGGLAGVIQLANEGFSIQPEKEGNGIESAHLVSRLPSRASLTKPEGKDRKKRQTASSGNKTGESLTGDEDMFTWYEVSFPSPDYDNMSG